MCLKCSFPDEWIYKFHYIFKDLDPNVHDPLALWSSCLGWDGPQILDIRAGHRIHVPLCEMEMWSPLS